MIFNGKTKRAKLEPGDTIRCLSAEDFGTLGDLLCNVGIPWEVVYEKDGQRGLWIEVLAEGYQCKED